jgi:peptide/nickel transport system permease protein
MRYVRKRLPHLVVVIVVSTFLSLLLLTELSTQGDVNQIASSIAGPGASAADLKEVENQFGLDKPIVIQYAIWAKNFIVGDFGTSYQYKVSVRSLITDRLPVSLQLMSYSLLLALVIAIPLGALAAYRANGSLDRTVTTVSFALLSIPNYVLAIILVYVFAQRLDWFPSISKYYSPIEDFGGHISNVALPAIALAAGNIAVFMRLLRADMVSTFQQDFVTMARAKGMSTTYLVWRHAFRPSTFALVTAAATNVGALIGGSVIIEQIFAYPGMGNLLVDAIFRRDLLTVQACVVVFSLVYVLINFLVDLSYAFIDPRVRDMRSLA